MGKLTQEQIVNELKNSDYLFGNVNGQVVQVSVGWIRRSGYKGPAIPSTVPDNPTAGDYYKVNLSGVFPHFGNQQANKHEEFWWNGVSWDLYTFEDFLEDAFRGDVEPNDPLPLNIENSHWVRCQSNGTYVNFDNITAVGGDILSWNEALGVWKKTSTHNYNIVQLTSNMNADNHKIENLADGTADGDAVNYKQLQENLAMTI